MISALTIALNAAEDEVTVAGTSDGTFTQIEFYYNDLGTVTYTETTLTTLNGSGSQVFTPADLGLSVSAFDGLIKITATDSGADTEEAAAVAIAALRCCAAKKIDTYIQSNCGCSSGSLTDAQKVYAFAEGAQDAATCGEYANALAIFNKADEICDKDCDC